MTNTAGESSGWHGLTTDASELVTRSTSCRALVTA
jgi:hypothetical protein